MKHPPPPRPRPAPAPVQPQPPMPQVHAHVVDGHEMVTLYYQASVSRWPAQLSPSEREVAACVVAGLSAGDIAVERNSSVNTVRNQLASMYQKLGVDGRAGLVARLLDAADMPPPRGPASAR